MIHDEAIKKIFYCRLNLFDYPFDGLQPRFGVCRTIRQNGASTIRPGEIHDEDVGVVVSRRISAAFFHVIKGVVIQSSLCGVVSRPPPDVDSSIILSSVE